MGRHHDPPYQTLLSGKLAGWAQAVSLRLVMKGECVRGVCCVLLLSLALTACGG